METTEIPRLTMREVKAWIERGMKSPWWYKGLKEKSAARVAAALKAKGYSEVAVLLGGFQAWQQVGYPITPHQSIPL